MNYKKDKIRLREIKTKHGNIQTPFFMPDATRGFVKSISNNLLQKIGVEVLVINTFHLMLHIQNKDLSSLRKLINWQKPLLSDSGGFQIFSLIHKNPNLGSISDKGVVFKSPLNGLLHELTPEKSIQIQFDLGVDMMVVLDDCPPNEYDKKELSKSVERTIAWASRSKVEYEKQIKKRNLKNIEKPLLFSVIQGGTDLELRKKCAYELTKIGFDGYGFGARPVDQDGNFLADVLRLTANLIPKDSLRFALGIGTPDDIVKCIQMGWDMFDCVIPTREGRHGRMFSFLNNDFDFENFFYNTINITNAKFKYDFDIINPTSNITELKEHSKAYLNYLFKIKEPLGAQLASLNNLEFYIRLLKNIKN